MNARVLNWHLKPSRRGGYIIRTGTGLSASTRSPHCRRLLAAGRAAMRAHDVKIGALLLNLSHDLLGRVISGHEPSDCLRFHSPASCG
jgi:hypothetical protein